MLDCKYLSPGAARSLLAPGTNGGVPYAGTTASESSQGGHHNPGDRALPAVPRGP